MATAFIYRTSSNPADFVGALDASSTCEPPSPSRLNRGLFQFSHDDEQSADHADEDQHGEPDPHPLFRCPVFPAHCGSGSLLSSSRAPGQRQTRSGSSESVYRCVRGSWFVQDSQKNSIREHPAVAVFEQLIVHTCKFALAPLLLAFLRFASFPFG